MVSSSDVYRVRLDVFDGPLDLLLHLCRRQEVDIRDIPIAEVTEQYLRYLDLMQELNLEVAGSYLAMAATLCHVKSLMILPVAEPDGEDEEGPDPRKDLIRRLLEYEGYREAAERLVGGEILDRDTFEPLGMVDKEEPADRPVEGNLFLLLDALQDLLDRRKARPAEHRVAVTRFSVAGRMKAVVARMREHPRLAFTDLFDRRADREEILVTFLALLEMVRLRYVSIVQQEHLRPIRLRLNYVGPPEDLPVPGEEAGP